MCIGGIITYFIHFVRLKVNEIGTYWKKNLTLCNGKVIPLKTRSEQDRDITKSVGISVWATGLRAIMTRILKINPTTPKAAAKLPKMRKQYLL